MSNIETRRTVRGVRLQKAMADAGIGARRDCEEMITGGRVKVNGRLVTTLPCFIHPANDVVELDGEAVELPASEDADAAGIGAVSERGRALVYVLVNKPKGVITTTRDPEGRA